MIWCSGDMMIPIVLFAYARPGHLRRTLDSLKSNQVPVIYAYSDGPRTREDERSVAEVRKLLRAVDWCRIEICERETNLGLGRSILAGVAEVLRKHDAVIVFEDDLVCVPGTYDYLRAALERYREDSRVMSVTGWTHPIITPGDITDRPYFDCRAESWVWGTWRRAWKDMGTDAGTLMKKCKAQGLDIYRCGADMVEMAKAELRWNIWAVRFLYSHILNGGLCLRPPWSMVEHIGFDERGTNAVSAGKWDVGPLEACPPIPAQWPLPAEHPECALLHQEASGKRPGLFMLPYFFLRRMAPRSVRRALQMLKANILKQPFLPEFIKRRAPRIRR